MSLISVLRIIHTDYGWIFLTVAAVLYIALMAASWARSASWSPLHKAASLLFLILIDAQVFLGVIVYAAQQRWTGEDVLRSYEHPFHMLVALALFHVGYRQVKIAADSQRKVRAALIWSALCLAVFALGLWRILDRMGA